MHKTKRGASIFKQASKFQWPKLFFIGLRGVAENKPIGGGSPGGLLKGVVLSWPPSILLSMDRLSMLDPGGLLTPC